MKKIFTVAIMAAAMFTAKAQTATESVFEMGKTARPAFMIEVPYAPDVVEDALKKHFKDNVSAKGNESRGVRAYKGVVLSQVSADKMNYYTSVDRKSKKEKNISLVYMLIEKADGSFVAGATDESVANNAKQFLSSFMGTAQAYNHELQVKDQEDVLKKAQKKLGGIVDDIADYDKKIADYQRKLENAKRDKTNQEAVVAAEQKRLDELKAQK